MMNIEVVIVICVGNVKRSIIVGISKVLLLILNNLDINLIIKVIKIVRNGGNW